LTVRLYISATALPQLYMVVWGQESKRHLL